MPSVRTKVILKMTVEKKQSPQWLDFEKRVGQIFTLSGYSMEHDRLIGEG